MSPAPTDRLQQPAAPKSPAMPPSARRGEGNDKQEGKEEEEEPDKEGRRRWVGLVEEKVLEWDRGAENKAEHP